MGVTHLGFGYDNLELHSAFPRLPRYRSPVLVTHFALISLLKCPCFLANRSKLVTTHEVPDPPIHPPQDALDRSGSKVGELLLLEHLEEVRGKGDVGCGLHVPRLPLAAVAAYLPSSILGRLAEVEHVGDEVFGPERFLQRALGSEKDFDVERVTS